MIETQKASDYATFMYFRISREKKDGIKRIRDPDITSDP